MPSLGEADRRAVLRMIALGAAAALAGCAKPDEPIFARALEEDGERPGAVRRYATAIPLAGYARGVTGLVVDGRPIKIEGLANHPASLGATDLFAEAAILDLYDPQRLRAPTGPGGIASWTAVQRALLGRLAGTRGEGLRLLTRRITSPSLLARIAAMRSRLPAMRHYRAEPIDDDNAIEGARRAFGRPLSPRPRLADADVIVALDADFLGPGPEQIALARAWGARRSAPGGPQPLFVLEPSLSQTGVCADRRVAATPGAIADALLVLAHGLGAAVAAPVLRPAIASAVSAMLRSMAGAKGRAVILVGPSQPAAVHALAAWVNTRIGAPIDWIAPVDAEPLGHRASLAALAEEMHAGRVSTLVMLDANPVYHAPAALGFAEGMARVPLTLACARFASETLAAARWSAPLSDPLEAWGDLRSADGSASVAQPLIRPLYDTRSPLELLDLIDPPPLPQAAYAKIQAQWRAHGGGDFARWWRDTLVAGVVPGSASAPIAPPAAGLHGYPPSRTGSGLALTLAPSPTLWDGAFASNAWAQECPDPVTKELWGSSLRLAPRDAAQHGLAEGDRVALGGGEARVRIMPTQAEGAATLLLGYGRRDAGPIADTGGVNGFALRSPDAGAGVPLAALRRIGGSTGVTTTQHRFRLDGDLGRLFPLVAPGEVLAQPSAQPSLLPTTDAAQRPGPQWAMAIDTSICIGCNACVVACQAENNVPAIGPEEMAAERDMHWLRVDFYEDADGAPRGFQPVPCMQCETAPCEPVCPVGASVHDEQGLNVQVYNRCVGTRFCQSNCPYKVRRFNFRDYAGADLWGADDRGSVTAQRNPDVSVRSRGVMEKCNYCVQRIEGARREADASGAPLGPIETACQSACPTRAIHFGDLKRDPALAAHRASPRHYALLGELGTRPRTTYLARIRDDGHGEGGAA